MRIEMMDPTGTLLYDINRPRNLSYVWSSLEQWSMVLTELLESRPIRLEMFVTNISDVTCQRFLFKYKTWSFLTIEYVILG